eukprot:6478283-Amphidinium_carterae.1
MQQRTVEASCRWADRVASRTRWQTDHSYWWGPGHSAHRQTTHPLQKWALQALPSGSTWNQVKLFKRGLATHTTCALCGHPVADQWHRAFECEAFDKQQKLHLPSCVLHWAVTDGIRHFGRDLASLRFQQDTLLQLHTPEHANGITETWTSPTLVPAGPVYTDGAAQHPNIRLARAAGWAMVQLDANGLLARVSYGAVPSTLCPVQSSAEA